MALTKIISKYQRVKKIPLAAHLGCYCKIIVFSPFILKISYYHLQE